jgi:hypothetical protein
VLEESTDEFSHSCMSRFRCLILSKKKIPMFNCPVVHITIGLWNCCITAQSNGPEDGPSRLPVPCRAKLHATAARDVHACLLRRFRRALRPSARRRRRRLDEHRTHARAHAPRAWHRSMPEGGSCSTPWTPLGAPATLPEAIIST